MAITEHNLDEHVRLFEAEQRIAELEAVIARQQPWIDLLKHVPPEVPQSIREHMRLDVTDGAHPAYWRGYDQAWREWKRRYESVINDHRESRQRLQQQLTAKRDTLEAEVEAWKETAAQAYRNRDFYHGIVLQVMELLGIDAKTSDDGSIQEDIVALKVPELVQALRDGVNRILIARLRDSLQARTHNNHIYGNVDVIELFEATVDEVCIM